MSQGKDSFTLSPFTIKFKLILINSLVIIFALGTMIFLATHFFRQDSEARIKENLVQVTDVIGARVKEEITYLLEKTSLVVTTMEQDSLDIPTKESFLRLFFREDKYFLMVGIFSIRDSELKPIEVEYNKDFLREHELIDSDFLNLIDIHSKSLSRASSGQLVLTNTSPGMKLPSFALSVPHGKDTDRIIVAIVHLDRIKDSFERKTGIMETFLINDEGIIVAHPDEIVMFTAKDVTDSAVVKITLENQLEAGQTKFIDESGEAAFGSFKKLGLGGASVISYVRESKAFEEVYNIQRRNFYILVIALCISIFIIYNFSITLTKPLLRLVEATKEIQKGNFHPKIVPKYRDEVGVLTASFIEMGKGLEEREKVKNILGNMIDPVVVEEAMKDFDALKRGSERQITAFFSDVAGFSTISEKLTSVQLASLLNEYLGAMTIILKKYNGVLDKYIGDAIVGIFNAPIDIPSPALQACLASLEMIEKLKELKLSWKKNNSYIPEAHEMDIRIGLNSGLAKVGFMGTEALASYTMMGDTVNLAARLEAAGKDYGVNILISEMTYKQVENEVFARKLDLVRVKGKNEPVLLYELISQKGKEPTNRTESTALYEEGFSLYLNRDWQKAIEKLKQAEKARGEKDKAVNMLISRCEEYLQSPPEETWDGVFTRTHK